MLFHVAYMPCFIKNEHCNHDLTTNFRKRGCDHPLHAVLCQLHAELHKMYAGLHAVLIRRKKNLQLNSRLQTDV